MDGIASAAFRWRPSTLGVVLFDGVSEFALGSVVDTYGMSLARIHTIASERAVLTTKHGLALVPRWDSQSAPDVDRLLVPGDPTALAALPGLESWAHQCYGGAADLLQEQGSSFAYDAVLRYIAQHGARGRLGRCVQPGVPHWAPGARRRHAVASPVWQAHRAGPARSGWRRGIRPSAQVVAQARLSGRR